MVDVSVYNCEYGYMVVGIIYSVEGKTNIAIQYQEVAKEELIPSMKDIVIMRLQDDFEKFGRLGGNGTEYSNESGIISEKLQTV